MQGASERSTELGDLARSVGGVERQLSLTAEKHRAHASSRSAACSIWLVQRCKAGNHECIFEESNRGKKSSK
jgi:hypothetical protein